MKKIKFILFFVCCCLANSLPLIVNAQSSASFQFIRTIKGNFSYLNIDNLDNIYLITDNNQLKKLNANGDSVAVFNDVKRFGNRNYVDVTNALKAILY